jgi:hypothetical protein
VFGSELQKAFDRDGSFGAPQLADVEVLVDFVEDAAAEVPVDEAQGDLLEGGVDRGDLVQRLKRRGSPACRRRRRWTTGTVTPSAISAVRSVWWKRLGGPTDRHDSRRPVAPPSKAPAVDRTTAVSWVGFEAARQRRVAELMYQAA